MQAQLLNTGLVITGSVAAYLFAKISPQKVDNDEKIKNIVIQHSLSQQLHNTTNTAKAKAVEIGKFGFPSYSNLRFYDSFCASINYMTSVPNWSGECITKIDLTKNDQCDRKHSKFKSDESVPLPFRAQLTDYRGSGYSRGHLAPAGDHNALQCNKDATFTLSNVVPQCISMNGCDWLRVERFVKKLITSADNDLTKCWIFSGPVFKPDLTWITDPYLNGSKAYKIPIIAPKTDESDEQEEVIKNVNVHEWLKNGKLKGKMRYETIGPNVVHVPTHMFKVILAERGDVRGNDTPKYQLAAFMVQNEPIKEKLPLKHYLIDIGELEKHTGLEFFPKILHNTNANVKNVVEYAELCLNYKCEYDDDERSGGWRPLGLLKLCDTFLELKDVYKEILQMEFDAPWQRGMYDRAFLKRRKYLVKQYQKRINYLRRFEE